MDFTISIGLTLIIIALWSIKGALDRIANRPTADPAQFSIPRFPDLGGIEDQLRNINKILRRETEIKEDRAKKHKEHYSTLVKALILSGKTQEQAQKEADGYLEENDFDETLGEDYSELTHYSHPDRAMSALKWAKNQFIDDRNKKKYGHLLKQAREYLETVDQIGIYDHKMQDTLRTDWDGEQWLRKKLIEEGRLEVVKEYDSSGMPDIKSYKVIKA